MVQEREILILQEKVWWLGFCCLSNYMNNIEKLAATCFSQPVVIFGPIWASFWSQLKCKSDLTGEGNLWILHLLIKSFFFWHWVAILKNRFQTSRWYQSKRYLNLIYFNDLKQTTLQFRVYKSYQGIKAQKLYVSVVKCVK